MQGKKRTGALAAAITTTVLLLYSAPSDAANADMVSEFSKTCVAAKSQEDLKSALGIAGWKAFATLSQSHLEREIAAVTPMLEAQGLASDYTIYGWDGGSRHLELALSVTKNPIKDGRKLVGCSMYDFAANTSIDSAIVSVFAPTITGQKSTLADVQIEKWDGAFGEGSGMRAVFVPPASPMKAQLGFAGMMLGTHFFDGVR